MKRDVRLHGLSTDHHHALVFARRVADAVVKGRVDTAFLAELRARFDAELAPHFAIEEELLLPALREAGIEALVERTLRDHAELRAHLSAAEGGSREGAEAFAALLADHVRFEERELFQACEERLSASVLEEVARRAPKRG